MLGEPMETGVYYPARKVIGTQVALDASTRTKTENPRAVRAYASHSSSESLRSRLI